MNWGGSVGERTFVSGVSSDEIGSRKLETNCNGVLGGTSLTVVEVSRDGRSSLTEGWDWVGNSSRGTFILRSSGSNEETIILSVLGGSTTINLDIVSTGVPDLSGGGSIRGRVLDVNVKNTGHLVNKIDEITISHIFTEVLNDKLELEGEFST